MLVDQKKVGSDVVGNLTDLATPSAPSPSSASDTSHHSSHPSPLPSYPSPVLSNIPSSPDNHNSSKPSNNHCNNHYSSVPTPVATVNNDWKYDYELVLDGVQDEFFSGSFHTLINESSIFLCFVFWPPPITYFHYYSCFRAPFPSIYRARH